MWSAIEQFRLTPQSDLRIPACIALLTGLACMYIVHRDWQWRENWATPEKLPQQWRDGLCVLALSLPILLLCVYYQPDSQFVPNFLSSGTEGAKRWFLMSRLMYGLLGLAVVCFTAAKFGTSRAIVLLIVALYTGASNWKSGMPPAIPADSSYSLHFRTIDSIPGAMLWINGEQVGELPLSIDREELKKYDKVPKTFDGSRLRDNAYRDRTYLYSNDSYLWGVGFPKRDPMFEWNRCLIPTQNREAFDYRISVNDCSSYTKSIRAQSNYRTNEHRFLIDLRFKEWERQLTGLADVARLNDYQVSNEWCDAILSYEKRGWHFLRELHEHEPATRRLSDDVATRAYQLNDVSSASDAWRKLETIISDAVAQQIYDSQGIEGRAVELLAAKLPLEKLIDRAIQLTTDGQGVISQSYERHDWPNDLRIRQYLPQQGISNETGDAAIAHAIWYLRTSAAEPVVINELQAKLTPVLLANRSLQDANFIGGPLNDELTRRQFKFSARESQRSPDDKIKKYTRYRHLKKLIELDSPAGIQARLRFENEIIQLLKNGMSPHSEQSEIVPFRIRGYSEDHLKENVGFLFLSNGDSPNRNSLGWKIWPHVRTLAAADNRSLPIKWNYLACLWPESNVQMFVDTYLESDAHRYGPPTVLTTSSTLPTDVRFKILNQILQSLKSRQRTMLASDEESSEWAQMEKHIFQIEHSIQDLTCRGAAKIFLKLESARSARERPEQLRELMACDRYHDDHVELLAEHSNPVFRSAALLPIQFHPTKRRRAVLETLLQDNDDRIRSEAETVSAELKKLRTSPLPVRRLPSATNPRE